MLEKHTKKVVKSKFTFHNFSAYFQMHDVN